MPGAIDRHHFRDRHDAGRALAAHLEGYRGRDDVVVLGLPRGGVPVAAEVAAALLAPLDVFVVRKLGVPGHPELAMGAIASGGVRVLNDAVLRSLRIPPEAVDGVARAEAEELARRERAYRDGRAAVAASGRQVLLVDDGLATGASMRAAATAVRRLEPARVVVAVPIAPADACQDMRAVADEVVCVRTPDSFRSVGDSYEDFDQTGDDEVRDLLRRAALRQAAGPSGWTRPAAT